MKTKKCPQEFLVENSAPEIVLRNKIKHLMVTSKETKKLLDEMYDNSEPVQIVNQMNSEPFQAEGKIIQISTTDLVEKVNQSNFSTSYCKYLIFWTIQKTIESSVLFQINYIFTGPYLSWVLGVLKHPRFF